MKIKDRKMYPALVKRIKKQEERIKECGRNNIMTYLAMPRLSGTALSNYLTSFNEPYDYGR